MNVSWKGDDTVARLFLTALYFVILLFLIDLVFRNTLGLFTNILAVFCWVFALVASIIAADLTVKKRKEKHPKR